MVAQRPDPLTRVDATTEALVGLHEVFDAEEPLEDVLNPVAAAAVAAVADLGAATITSTVPTRPRLTPTTRR